MKGTLTSKREIEHLFAAGEAGKTHILTVIAREVGGADPDGRIMVIAGRGIGKAVRRNRAKRLLREAIRRAQGPWPGFHVAVIAKPALLAARREEIDDALRQALSRAGVMR